MRTRGNWPLKAFLSAQSSGERGRKWAWLWRRWRPTHAAGAEKVEHPLLQRRLNTAPDTVVFSAILDSRWQWVLDEHRVRGADPVLPGTGFVEMVRAALVNSGVVSADGAIELSDVTFTAPLIVPEKTPCSVDMEVRREADGSASVAIRSGTRRDPTIEHATARGRGLADWVPGHDRYLGDRSRAAR